MRLDCYPIVICPEGTDRIDRVTFQVSVCTYFLVCMCTCKPTGVFVCVWIDTDRKWAFRYILTTRGYCWSLYEMQKWHHKPVHCRCSLTGVYYLWFMWLYLLSHFMDWYFWGNVFDCIYFAIWKIITCWLEFVFFSFKPQEEAKQETALHACDIIRKSPWLPPPPSFKHGTICHHMEKIENTLI